ncbi:MAG: hypothetical protein ACNA7H_02900, partial [Desulfotignum sp.]
AIGFHLLESGKSKYMPQAQSMNECKETRPQETEIKEFKFILIRLFDTCGLWITGWPAPGSPPPVDRIPGTETFRRQFFIGWYPWPKAALSDR